MLRPRPRIGLVRSVMVLCRHHTRILWGHKRTLAAASVESCFVPMTDPRILFSFSCINTTRVPSRHGLDMLGRHKRWKG
jgi:hypothetical protein